MKKNIFGILGLALVMSACSEDYEDWAQPVQNSQQSLQTITLDAPQAFTDPIDLAAITDDSITIVNINASGDYTINSLTYTFESEEGITSSIPVDIQGRVSKRDLQKAINNVFGKDIQSRELINGTITGTGTANKTSVQTTELTVLLKSASVLKFTITPAKTCPDVVYYAGDAYGWGENMRPMAKNDMVFSGFYYINIPDGYKSFKFVADGTWCGGDDNSNIIENGGDNINPTDGAGFYKIVADWDNLKYSMILIDQVSLVGSAVNGDTNWGTDYDLTFNLSTKAWEGEYTLTDGEMKIRANHKWDISWGGDFDAMTSNNGANINVSAGKYKISFTPNCDGQGVLTMTPAN